MRGPVPKPDAERRRRNAVAPMTMLPVEGRTDPAPTWPLPSYVSDEDDDGVAEFIAESERDIWLELWRTPQAVAWERLGAGTMRMVARYCRYLIMAEAGNMKAAPEARMLEDRLGLTPAAMARLRWRIADDEVAEARDEKTKTTATAARKATAARRKLRAVDPGAVAGA